MKSVVILLNDAQLKLYPLKVTFLTSFWSEYWFLKLTYEPSCEMLNQYGFRSLGVVNLLRFSKHCSKSVSL